MFHPRGFAHHENQPFAAQTRTPGPSRSHLSPSRSQAMTTGKRALGGKSHLFGQEPGSVGPKQLFKELASKTPARALGDRTNKTPGFRNRQGQEDSSPVKKGQASPSKGKGLALQSPAKSSQCASPKKAGAQPLRMLNGKLKDDAAAAPFSKADQSYATEMSSMLTPAPSGSALRGRLLSRQTSYVTPAANIGKAGQIKAKMGEILDAELGIHVDGSEVAEVEQLQVHRELTEEELYPEIEYMPPSTWASNPPYEYPSELDGVPSSKELAKRLAAFRPAGFLKGAPAELSDSEDVKRFDSVVHDASLVPGLCAPTPFDQDQESDDDLWPDEPVASESERAAKVSGPITSGQRSSTASVARPASSISKPAVRSSGATSRASAMSQPGTGSRPSAVPCPTSRLTRPSKITSDSQARTSANASSASRLTGKPTSAATAALKTAAATSNASGTSLRKAVPTASTTAARPTSVSSQSRSTALKRSIAPPAASLSARSGPARPSARAPASTAPRRAEIVSKGAMQKAAQPKMQMNAKLRDLANDDLGRFVEAKLKETTTNAGFEGFDLGSEPEPEADPDSAAAAQPTLYRDVSSEAKGQGDPGSGNDSIISSPDECGSSAGANEPITGPHDDGASQA